MNTKKEFVNIQNLTEENKGNIIHALEKLGYKLYSEKSKSLKDLDCVILQYDDYYRQYQGFITTIEFLNKPYNKDAIDITKQYLDYIK